MALSRPHVLSLTPPPLCVSVMSVFGLPSVCLTSFHFLRVSSLVSPVCHLLPCLLVPFPNVKLTCPFLGLDARVTSCFILRVSQSSVLLLRSSCVTSLSPWLCVLLVSKCSLLFPGHHVS